MSYVGIGTVVVGAGIKAGTAIHQAHQAKKMNLNRPTYQIPDEVKQNQDMYKQMANSSRLPGQSVMENNIGANNSSAINAAMSAGGSSSDVLATLGNINNNSDTAYNNLAVEGAQNQNNNKANLAGANNNMADYKNQAFNYNQNEPYQMAYARKMALQTAANANLSSAMTDTSNSGTMIAMNNMNKKKEKEKE